MACNALSTFSSSFKEALESHPKWNKGQIDKLDSLIVKFIGEIAESMRKATNPQQMPNYPKYQYLLHSDCAKKYKDSKKSPHSSLQVKFSCRCHQCSLHKDMILGITKGKQEKSISASLGSHKVLPTEKQKEFEGKGKSTKSGHRFEQ
jgi:hypothetical protein